MNERKGEHIWGQPNSWLVVAVCFFFIQLMIVFSFCKQLVEDISVHPVNVLSVS